MVAVALLILFAGALIGLLPMIERRSIYFPTAAYEAAPEDFGMRAETLEIPSADGVRLAGWWIRGSGRTALLYFHGNGGDNNHPLEPPHELVENPGLDAFFLGHSGYGRGAGSPRQARPVAR